MKRVWLVDDKIPLGRLFGDVPVPARCTREVVQLVLARVESDDWEEPDVRALCETLLTEKLELSCFLSPQGVLAELEDVQVPPHAVIFDWEGPGFNPDLNLDVIEKLLSRSPTCVQVYSHIGPAAIEPLLGELQARFPVRLLQVRTKGEVEPSALSSVVAAVWKDTIGGPIADEVRRDVRRAAETALVDLTSIPRGEIAALVHQRKEALLGLIFSKIREEVRALSSPAWDAVLRASEARVTTATTRQLLSSVYYMFPADNRMRRGDLVSIDGDPDADALWLVTTPPCDLERFKEKTGRRLVLVKALPLTQENVATLKGLGCRFDKMGASIVGRQGKSGDLYVPLPNVPLRAGSRSDLSDYLLLSHAWDSRTVSVKTGLGYPEYDPEDLPGIHRRCTLAEGIAEAVISKLTNVLSSPGLADLPSGEVDRMSAVFNR